MICVQSSFSNTNNSTQISISLRKKKPLQNIFRKGFKICIEFYSSLSASSAMPSIRFVTTVLSSAAFFDVITGLPVDSSIAFLVSPAMLPLFSSFYILLKILAG